MMTYIGGLLCLVCGGAFISIWFGYAPEALLQLGVPVFAWVGGALFGAVLLYFNRRPGN